jgi:hypothetical protein
MAQALPEQPQLSSFCRPSWLHWHTPFSQISSSPQLIPEQPQFSGL